MKIIDAFAFALGSAVVGVFLPAANAVTATGLSSFEGIEEPLVKFFPATEKFERDAFVNITDVGGGTVRMTLRYNAEWWDGDRDTLNKDRQRAEVKGLGPHQKHGDTFDYETTWRSNPGFRGSNGFCHIFQLKATNGDSGAPLITLSIRGDKATVEANPAGPKIVAREFPWKADRWQTVRIRVKTSPQADGELLVSVDGDAFQGKTGVALSRPDSNDYRPKWGLYRRAAPNVPQLHDDFVEHRNVCAQRVGGEKINNLTLETEARTRAEKSSPHDALIWLLAQSGSSDRDFVVASIAAEWAETEPAAAMVWAEKLPEGAMRRDAMTRIFSRWADRNVQSALGWLRARAPDPALDQIAWLFATDTTYRYVQRELALDAARLIHDPELRAKAFEHVVEIWARTQHDAAAKFIEQTPALSPEQKHRIIARLKSRRGAGEN